MLPCVCTAGLLPAIADAAKPFASALSIVKQAELRLLMQQVSAQRQPRQAIRDSPAVAAADGGPCDSPLEPRVVGVSAESQLLGYICIQTTNALVQCWPGKLLVSDSQC
jgi:hypothetical protein